MYRSTNEGVDTLAKKGVNIDVMIIALEVSLVQFRFLISFCICIFVQTLQPQVLPFVLFPFTNEIFMLLKKKQQKENNSNIHGNQMQPPHV